MEGIKKSIVQIRGESMSPSLKDGDIALLSCTPSNCISRGDIIAFYSHGKIIVHRVLFFIRIKTIILFITKGDNRLLPDPIVLNSNRLIGKVKLLRQMGKEVIPLGNSR